MRQYCQKLFVPFFVYALRAIVYCGRSFSIDMNAIWAIVYCGRSFSIDMNALWAIVYCGRSFSIDIISLWAIVAISHREIMSIERIRCMYCFVRRTLTTKSERKFFNNAPNFLHPTHNTAELTTIALNMKLI